MRRIWLPALMSILLMGTTVVPALAGEDLPFKADADRVWAGPLGPNPSCPDGYLGEDSEYTGTGTHLGRFSLFETLCLDFRTPPIVLFEVYGDLVAANGDHLNFRVEGDFNLITGVMTSSGFVFTGGTGRFESAEGHAQETLIRDSGGTIIGLTAVGTITFDASDRSG
ncbi:MAG: hypothetical protein ABFS21_11905 [Actinomycetota bacterium]